MALHFFYVQVIVSAVLVASKGYKQQKQSHYGQLHV